MEYFISDTHFGHKNICGKDGFTLTRKHYKSVDEMNEDLVANWNSVITNTDEVYHLGDFALGIKPGEALSYLRRLKGREIHLIKGNHDNTQFKKAIAKDEELSKRVDWHDVGMIIKRNKRVIYLTHYPLITGNRGGLVNFHGHVHEMAWKEPNLINVGVDSPERDHTAPVGTPMALEQVLAKLALKQLRYCKENRDTAGKYGTMK